MVTRVGPLASSGRKPRQARKGAAVAAGASAGVWLMRVASISWFIENPSRHRRSIPSFALHGRCRDRRQVFRVLFFSDDRLRKGGDVLPSSSLDEDHDGEHEKGREVEQFFRRAFDR